MKRILTAVDLGPSSPCVVEKAVELARSVGGKVRLVHVVVVEPQIPPPGIFVVPVTLRLPELRQWAERELRGLEENVPPELQDGLSIEFGHPCEHVCDLARRYDADVVVIGAHQYGRIAKALGTTAARIVNSIDRPVFVVRPLPRDRTACIAEPVKASST